MICRNKEGLMTCHQPIKCRDSQKASTCIDHKKLTSRTPGLSSQVVTRGRYMAPGTPFTDVDKPLHLHITPGACSTEVNRIPCCVCPSPLELLHNIHIKNFTWDKQVDLTGC